MKVRLPPTVEVVLQPDADNETCGYYFVNHEFQTIFWINDVMTSAVGLTPLSPASRYDLENALHQQYYAHIEYFPNHTALVSLVDMPLDQLLISWTEGMTNSQYTSTFPFDAGECQKLLDLLRNINDLEYTQSFRVSAMARLLGDIYAMRLFNFHGDLHARLSRLEYVIEPERKPKPILISVVPKLLWDVPMRHQKRLADLWVDGITYFRLWGPLVNDLRLEWNSA
ncbi:hypothetical protein SISNIDRAFT_408878, partial [Sistotremastrum niveocremeum HHB9708]